ncbi:polysaccharide deacetylase family protein [Granulicoccus sp. GXG6511]|uniref:polysaccharide deacetylase family protein n=1 Tax=Granulicoccus sp. GXG6511 TaxID=3381351 RepID=UPI003D7D087B
MPESPRVRLKRVLAGVPGSRPAEGATLLIYHRLGGGTPDELDLPADAFERQVDLLAGHDVVSLDAALDRLDADERRASFVLTFDDGFEDVYQHAWPLLRERQLPFTIYVATAYLSKTMRWEGATAKGSPGKGLSWDQLAEMVDSGLCTIGNHTHNHVPPAELTEVELDRCTAEIEQHLGVTPRHFTYPWGVPVPGMEDALRERFRSSSTGELGRNAGLTDRMRLKRVPVRRTDPDEFFAAKLTGNLAAERAYAGIVRVAKAVGMSS